MPETNKTKSCKPGAAEVRVVKLGLSFLALAGLSVGSLYSASAVEQNTTFQVNVAESLTVAITAPSSSTTGNVDDFLRNKVNVSVSTNVTSGFTASMTMQTTSTQLMHDADLGSIPTLESSVARSAFPANYWGYSLNDTEAGNSASTYGALVGVNGTPISLITNAQSSTISSRDVYFGARADASKPSGTYTGTVLISVVTGAIEEDPTDPGYNPTIPDNPVTPNPVDNTPEYSGANTTTGGTTNGATSYTYRRSSGSTTTTTTEVSSGDNRDAYAGYTPPQGVVDRSITTTNISEGGSLVSGLAAAAAVAATSGTIFFILAKRKKDEEEEEEEA